MQALHEDNTRAFAQIPITTIRYCFLRVHFIHLKIFAEDTLPGKVVQKEVAVQEVIPKELINRTTSTIVAGGYYNVSYPCCVKVEAFKGHRAYLMTGTPNVNASSHHLQIAWKFLSSLAPGLLFSPSNTTSDFPMKKNAYNSSFTPG